MPENYPRLRVPSYRRHKPSGQAVVTIGGHDVYLGNWGTKASKTEYQRVVGEWLAGGCCRTPKTESVSVAELAVAYLRFAKGYYRKNGQPTDTLQRVKTALRHLRETYESTSVAAFGPLALKAIQQKLVENGLSRPYCNYLTQTIRRIFKWGVAQEIVPESVYRALACVPDLRKGRTKAREPEPVRPVCEDLVQATLPHLPEVVADMVRFQRLTGCRPAEVCKVRPCDVDTSGDVWLYRVDSHKTEHHDRQRVIAIGPKAQDLLRPYLLRRKDSCCFVPAESEKKRLAQRHADRRTPLSCGNRPGSNRKRRPKKQPGNRYSTDTYRQAIHQTIAGINRERKKQDSAELPKWSPNRLRHSAGTEVRKQFGLEAAQVVLGHAAADVTQVYAERDLDLAKDVMRKIG